MSNFEITTYNKKTGIPSDLAENVSAFFATHYPASHSDEERFDDISGLANGQAVEAAVDEGSTFYLASESALLAGFIKSKTVDVEGGTYEHLNWIMIAEAYRGRRLASLLHRSFIFDATRRSIERAPRPTIALLNVHPQNPARDVYEHWGYHITGTTASGKLFMSMELPGKE